MSQWASEHIAALKRDGAVKFRPTGRSMEPLVMSGQLVHVRTYTYPTAPRLGDIVLCTVGRDHYLHRIGAVNDRTLADWYRIENAWGNINGWIGPGQIHGYVERISP